MLDDRNVEKLFGERLRQARMELGISQAELARRIGKSEVSVGAWESGNKSPRFSQLAKLAEVLDRPVAWFFLRGELIDEGSVTRAVEPDPDYYTTALPLIREAMKALRAAQHAIESRQSPQDSEFVRDLLAGTPYAHRPDIIAGIAQVLKGGDSKSQQGQG